MSINDTGSEDLETIIQCTLVDLSHVFELDKELKLMDKASISDVREAFELKSRHVFSIINKKIRIAKELHQYEIHKNKQNDRRDIGEIYADVYHGLAALSVILKARPLLKNIKDENPMLQCMLEKAFLKISEAKTKWVEFCETRSEAIED